MLNETIDEAESTGTQILTVTDLTRKVKGLLEGMVGKVWVSGEISNWRVSPAGHAYFTLKDEKSQLSAVIFKGKLSRVKFEPESGQEVLLQGLVTVYEARGNYQIICDDMQPKGVGALQLAFEKLKAKLDEEGLFDEDNKKALPLLPKKIGIVTSPTGAAIRDMLNVLNRRFSEAHIILYPARVQGEEAAPEIVAGIEALDEYGVDVLIIGRGGGSLEDLWPFNEESVVRAVFDCATPIVSAVGHEIDFALSDFAADLRAPTPSAAAELVVQEFEALSERVDQLKVRLSKGLQGQLESFQYRLERVRSSFIFQRPEELVRQFRQRLDDSRMSLEDGMDSYLSSERNRVDRAVQGLRHLSPANQLFRIQERLTGIRKRLIQSAAAITEKNRGQLTPLLAQLDALSPLSILSRGYSLVRKGEKGAVVSDVKQLSPSETVHIRLGKGSTTATIETLNPE
jgi:exodeoxyribonuclease VII large subunit